MIRLPDMFRPALSGSRTERTSNGLIMKNGFTLVELLVTVAIVSILAFVAMPSYRNYTMRADRTDGIEAMQQLLDAQERFYADNMEYADDLKDLGLPNSTMNSNRGLYVISVEKCTGMGYSQCVQLRAKAQGNQAADGDLLFNSAGKQARVVGGSEVDL
ncbi:MAG: pilus assembly protein PilE [Oceanospirillaceae bacterium]|nr:pilus assembly protein PilE [Oceanospirillaceae bacterium]MAX98187.1 pilus assembly protein PilE [Oceanospirillaceae bacterium]MBL35748.1 pilus assembly protein PilE [Oceanospirillaceae bacterium]MBS52731.1 pilus assembly protein PilE [Oceanospirillaceae bacterium]